MTDRAFRAMVADKLVSRSHWILLPGIAGLGAVQEIKDKFYRAGPPADFAEYITPVDKLGFYGFAFAAKKRGLAAKLAEFIRSQPLENMDSRQFTSVDLMQHDVIVLAAPEEAVILIQNFYQWVGLKYEEAT